MIEQLEKFRKLHHFPVMQPLKLQNFNTYAISPHNGIKNLW